MLLRERYDAVVPSRIRFQPILRSCRQKHSLRDSHRALMPQKVRIGSTRVVGVLMNIYNRLSASQCCSSGTKKPFAACKFHSSESKLQSELDLARLICLRELTEVGLRPVHHRDRKSVV